MEFHKFKMGFGNVVLRTLAQGDGPSREIFQQENIRGEQNNNFKAHFVIIPEKSPQRKSGAFLIF